MSIIFDGTATNNLDMGTGRNFLRNVSASTLMGWGLLTALGTSRAMIAISVGTSTSTRTKLSVLSGGTVELRARSADGEAGSAAFASPALIVPGQRFFVAGTIDYVAKLGLIYVFTGGALTVTAGSFSTMTAAPTSDTAAQTGTIGAHETGTTNPWIGYIEDPRVYGRQLSAAEIQTVIVSKGADGITDSLQGRWLLNEKPTGQAVSLVADLSPNAYALAISGSLVYGASEIVGRRRRQSAKGRR